MPHPYRCLWFLWLLALPQRLPAAESRTPAASAPAPTQPQGFDWLAIFLPKSLQANPELELTVITEMSDAGKKLPPVSRDHPAYYVAHSMGYQQHGDVSGGEKTLKAEEIGRLLESSLKTGGYLPAEAAHQPPSLAIIYMWGTHNTLEEGDPDNSVHSYEEIARNFLDRAALVGGEKLARELRQLLKETADFDTAANAQLASGGQPPISPELQRFANPVNLYKLRGPKNENLLTQSANDVYYVVASAYDYRTVASKDKVLLWRTRMTVASAGLSQLQSLPELVRSAGPYFGKEMTEPELLNKRSLREGNVEVGTPTVVDSPAPLSPAKPDRGPK